MSDTDSTPAKHDGPTVPGPGQFANEAPRDAQGHPVQPAPEDRPTSAADALGEPVLSEDAPRAVTGEPVPAIPAQTRKR